MEVGEPLDVVLLLVLERLDAAWCPCWIELFCEEIMGRAKKLDSVYEVECTVDLSQCLSVQRCVSRMCVRYKSAATCR